MIPLPPTRRGVCRRMTRGGFVFASLLAVAVGLFVVSEIVRASGHDPRALRFAMGILCGALFVSGGIWFRTRPIALRFGGQRHCRACLYPAEPRFDRCPECGADLTPPHATWSGEPEDLRQGWVVMVVLGAAMLAGSVYFTFL